MAWPAQPPWRSVNVSRSGLALYLASRYARLTGVPLAELVQEASLGLARAACRFDPSRGWRFSTYAAWHVRGAVLNAVACASEQRTAAASGDDATDELEAVADVSSGSNDWSENVLLRVAVTDAVAQLNRRQRDCLMLRFGFDGAGGRTLDEVGRLIGVSCERVRQIESKALEELRAHDALIASLTNG